MIVPRRRRQRHVGPTPFTARQGLTAVEVQGAWERQHGLCAICRRPLTVDYVADHSHSQAVLDGHEPGRGCRRCFRALLCSSCNTVLGMARDDPEVLERAARYVRMAP